MFARLATTILTGTSLGATLMYLLDPDNGPKHRKRVRQTAENLYDGALDQYDSAVESAPAAWANLKERAGETTTSVRRGLSHHLAAASRRLSPDEHFEVAPEPEMDLSPAQSYTAFALSRHSRDLYGDARDAYSRARDMYYDALIDLDLSRARVRREVPRPKPVAAPKPKTSSNTWTFPSLRRKSQSPDYLMISLVAAGCLALGASTMFMTDPVSGRRRRALVRDKAYKAARRTTGAVATGVGRATRYTTDHAKGAVARTKSTLRKEDEVADAKLVARIRSEMGRVVTHPHAVEIKSDNGCVTLAGAVPATEFDALMKCVYNVPGVCEVINQLSTDSPTRS